MRTVRALFSRPSWGVLLSLFVLLVLACEIVIQRGSAPTTTPWSTTPTPITAQPPTTPPTSSSTPATPPPEQPPEVPLLNLDQTAFRWQPDAFTYVAEIWDYPAGGTLKEREGTFYVEGGDAYDLNIYERPFTPLTQDTFWPDLDIRYARMVREDSWMYVVIQLHGLRPGHTAPAGEYGVELDLNLDGRGDVLLWARGPFEKSWSWDGLAVYTDTNRDVGDQRACTSDAPHRRSDGYDQVRWQEGRGDLSGAAWVRTRTENGYPVIEFAFPLRWISAGQPRLLWRVWTDTRIRDPQVMDYHDTFTQEEAGSPYPGNRPIDAIAETDNTCYTTFGYRPLGIEPCVCRNIDPLHPLCPDPLEAPGETCTALGDGWQACSSEDNETIFCYWDTTFCRWDCGQQPFCPPKDPSQQRALLLEFLEELAASGGGEIQVDLGTPQWLTCRVENDQLQCEGLENLDDLPMTELACVELYPGNWWCAGSDESLEGFFTTLDFGIAIWENVTEDKVITSPTVQAWSCGWSASLCRYVCGRQKWCVDPGTTLQAVLSADKLRWDDECVLENNVYSCTFADGETVVCRISEDGTQLDCDFRGGEEGDRRMVWHYDQQSCRFYPETFCQIEFPTDNCESVGENEWLCRWYPECYGERFDRDICHELPEDYEPEITLCTWDPEICLWSCRSCDLPDDTCAYDETREKWVCPGRGVFEGCEWVREECRWRCWGPERPQRQEEETCQPENYCRYVCAPVAGGTAIVCYYQCQNGEQYGQCTYDGCIWICDGQPVP